MENTNYRFSVNNYYGNDTLALIAVKEQNCGLLEWLINNGANIVMVAKYLGHTKIDETLNTYSHMYRNKLDDIVKTIDKLNEQ